jgi:hypothetical protein
LVERQTPKTKQNQKGGKTKILKKYMERETDPPR